MKNIYYYTEGCETCEPLIHLTLSEAISHAQLHNLPLIEKVTLTKDAIVRLHNGGGGYVENSVIVWKDKKTFDGIERIH